MPSSPVTADIAMKRTFSPSAWSRDRGSSHSLSRRGSAPLSRSDYIGDPWRCSGSHRRRSNDDHAGDIEEYPCRCPGSHRRPSNDDHADDIGRGPTRSSWEHDDEIMPYRRPGNADEHRYHAVGAASSSICAGSSPPRKVTFLVSNSSDEDSQTNTDDDDDNHHDYKMPVPRGDNLRVPYDHLYGSWRCPVCPGKKVSRWRNRNEIKDHVVGMAKSGRLKEENKKWSCHRLLARNEGWML